MQSVLTLGRSSAGFARSFSSETLQSLHPGGFLFHEATTAARRGASKWPPSAISGAGAAEAAHLLRVHYADAGALPPECTVPIHQLIRTIATFQRWKLPTVVAPDQVRTAADLVTGFTREGEPLLVAFPDDESIAAHARVAGFDTVGSIEMSSQNLLETWHGSQQQERKLGGIVFHTAETAAASAEHPTPFVNPILSTMLGLSYSVRVEAAVRVLQLWMDAGSPMRSAPVGEMHLLSRHPWSVLHHKQEGSLLNRLCDGSTGDPVLFSAADTAICEHLQLNTQTDKYEINHCTMGMVLRAMSRGTEPLGLRLVYGWHESITTDADPAEPANVWEGGQKLVLDVGPEVVPLFKEAADVDLLADPTSPQ